MRSLDSWEMFCNRICKYWEKDLIKSIVKLVLYKQHVIQTSS